MFNFRNKFFLYTIGYSLTCPFTLHKAVYLPRKKPDYYNDTNFPFSLVDEFDSYDSKHDRMKQAFIGNLFWPLYAFKIADSIFDSYVDFIEHFFYHN